MNIEQVYDWLMEAAAIASAAGLDEYKEKYLERAKQIDKMICKNCRWYQLKPSEADCTHKTVPVGFCSPRFGCIYWEQKR